VLQLLNIYTAPKQLFLSLKQKPNWILPFVVISVAAVLVEWFSFPFVLKLTLASLPPNAAQQHVNEAAAYLSEQRFINMSFIPVKLLFGLSIFALLLYYSCLIFKPREKIQFKQLLTAVVFSEMILMVGRIISFVIVLSKGVGHVNTISELNNSFGLDLLLPVANANLPMYNLMSSINPFSVWYIAVLSVGVSILSGFSKAKAAILTTSLWLVVLGFGAAVIQLVLVDLR
jgi:hypothetical protein